MMKLDNFVGMMTGHFDNKDQFNKMQAEGKTYPYAEHVNTICNDKINNLPEDFKGKFVVEESYYEINGKRHASPHLFLITEIEQGILLSSYKIPKGEDKNTFSYDSKRGKWESNAIFIIADALRGSSDVDLINERTCKRTVGNL